jgi:hypothetical protein
VSHKPRSQADEPINKVVTAYSLDPMLEDSSTLACSFFPGPGKQGLPTEIRQQIYDEAVSLPWLHSKYKEIITRDHYIYYEDTSQALALLRNGSVWENDACNAPEVKLAIRPFTLHVYWEALSTRGGHEQGYLVGLLKGLDVVFAIDQEHQRASSIAPRKWTVPPSPTVLKYGYSILRSFLIQEDNWWTFKNEDRENKWYQKQAPGAFLQTAILHLRRSPVINIRVFVYARYPPEDGDWEADHVRNHIRALLTPLRRGITNTKLPRSAKDWIRHHITLVAYDSQFSYWIEKLKCFDGEVQWEKATQDESHVGPEEPAVRYFGY